MFRAIQDNGVLRDTTDRLTLATAVGLNVNLSIGKAGVRGHFYNRDAAGDLVITANASGNDRIDLVVLKLDPTANSVVAAVLAGTPAGSPVAPTPTQTDTGVYELPLHEVYVVDGASGFTAGDFTDARVFPGGGVPIASITPYAGDTAPDGWQLCDGTAVSRTTYSELFEIIGTTFGPGNGSTTFDLPDLRGRFPIGAKTGLGLNASGAAGTAPAGTPSATRSRGAWGGEETHLNTSAESGMPAHNHSITDPGHFHAHTSPANFAGSGGLQGAQAVDTPNTASATTGISVNNSSAPNAASRHNTVGPFLALNFIIRY